jgi:hypothetical protein
MSEFNREDRYIVIKRKDLNAVPFAALHSFLEHLRSLDSFLPRREFVVVESDWPECEQVWRMIEARVTGRPSDFDRLEAEAQALREEVAALRARVMVVPSLDYRNDKFAEGWNSCIDEIADLNGKAVSEGLLRRCEQMLQFYFEYLCDESAEDVDIAMAAGARDELRALLGEGKKVGDAAGH